MIILKKAIPIRRFAWQIALVNGIAVSGIVGWTASAAAQVRPIADDTLGDEGSIVVPLDPQVPVDLIEGGAQRGNNLFHSFREFHVDQERGVYFSDLGVDNILTRVTGGVESQILGVLGVLGDANLFLINPSGIIFGSDAQLDIRGSFVATTADAVSFSSQGFFSATDPTAPSLLTVQPSAFLFNQLNPAPIANNSTTPAAENPSVSAEFGLRVPEGEGLTLLGGNVSMDGGGLTALGGRVEIGGLSQPGTVTLNMDGSLGFPVGVARSDVSLTNGSRINAIDVATNGGSITVTARELEIADSSLSAGTGDDSSFVGVRAGDIALNASDIRAIGTTIDNVVRGSSGDGGDIRITADSFLLTDNTIVQATLLGQGSAGNVILNADDRVVLDASAILSNVGGADRSTVAVGNGGNIQIVAPSLSLINGAQLQSVTFGQGDAGNVIIEADDRVSLDGGSAIFSTVERSENTIAEGNGGDIHITTDSLSLTNEAQLAAGTSGQGDAGNVIINARDRATFDASAIFSNVNPGAVGAGGDIHITTDSLSLTNEAQLAADTSGQGDAGNVIINARDRATFDASAIFSNVNPGAVGAGGDIHITTGSLGLAGARFIADTSGQGDAGNMNINVRDRATFDNSTIASNVGPGTVNNGGDIRITADSFLLTDNTIVQATLLGQGNAGNVILNADDRVVLDASAVFSNVGGADRSTVAVGNGGNIQIVAPSLSLVNGAQLQSVTFGQGDAGNVIIEADDRVSLDGGSAIFSTVERSENTIAEGNGGDIHITTDSLSLTNEAQLAAGTSGQGDAGNVIINARDRATFDASAIFSNVNPGAVGAGGDIHITTDSLSLTNRAQFIADTSGQGDAGNVIINARDRATFDASDIFSDVSSANSNALAEGDGGDIRITTGSLLLANGAQFVANTSGQGDAGNVIIDAGDRVDFDDSAIFSNVSSRTTNTVPVGNGGNIEITAPSLSLINGAQLQSVTFGQGDAGNVIISVDDRVSLEGVRQEGSEIFQSAIFTTTVAGAQGRGGNVRIAADSVRLANGASISTETENAFPGGTVTLDANTFEATAGGQVITATRSSGQAGSITLNVPDRITLSGVSPFNLDSDQDNTSGLFANTSRNSSGQGGTVQLTTGRLQVLDQARISVSSQGSGIAGNIDITASRVQLDDQARLVAETAAADGGNITLRDVELLLLRNNSLISTTAGTDRTGGNGGNININADFIVAFPNTNSDIRANAFSGRGGNVQITTEGLFGIAAQPQDNPFTNDITASSQLGVQGTVDITPPDVDLRRGLTELPVEVVDASNQIAQTCSGAGTGGSAGEFIVTGRGGVSPAPTDPLIGEESLAGWSTLDEETAVASQFPEGRIAPPNRETDVAATIVEAQEWVVAEDGTVKLMAAAPASAAQTPAICQSPENR